MIWANDEKLAEQDDANITAPLELLITTIRALAETQLELSDDNAFLEWLRENRSF